MNIISAFYVDVNRFAFRKKRRYLHISRCKYLYHLHSEQQHIYLKKKKCLSILYLVDDFYAILSLGFSMKR